MTAFVRTCAGNFSRMKMRTGETIPVWDRFVRVAHWTLAVTVIGAWLTRHSAGWLHEWLGYAALVIIAVRLIWRIRGSHYARFRSFVHAPRATWLYAKQFLTHSEPRHIDHNPLDAWMIIALIVSVVSVSATGWLFTTDAYWGVEWVAELHEHLSDVLVALMVLHVAGVVLASVRHRENLAAAMVHGRKRAPQTHEVQ